MSVESIVACALENNPIQMKKEFETEIGLRVQKALEEKYKKMTAEEEGEMCDHCEGKGVHMDEEGNEVECPKCEGTGYLKDEMHDDDDSKDDDE